MKVESFSNANHWGLQTFRHLRSLDVADPVLRAEDHEVGGGHEGEVLLEGAHGLQQGVAQHGLHPAVVMQLVIVDPLPLILQKNNGWV